MKRVFSKLNNIIIFRHKRQVFLAFICAFVLVVLGYFANNASLFTGENTLQYYVTQKICELLGVHRTVSYGDNVFFNVAYDKELIPVKDGVEPLGYRAITDRGTLSRFLELLAETKSYKFLILDLTFDASDKSPHDDRLANAIKQLDNVVFAKKQNRDSNEINLFPQLDNKSAYANYMAAVGFTNFSRIKYLHGDGVSIPMFVYKSLHNDKPFRKWGGRCFRALFFRQPSCTKH